MEGLIDMLETLEELENNLKSPGTMVAVHVQKPITSTPVSVPSSSSIELPVAMEILCAEQYERH